MTSSSSSSAVDSILSSADPSVNSYDTMGLTPLQLYDPSVIRRTFYKLSLQVHPDKCALPEAKRAFQKLSQAFEILYDLESQKQHLQQITNERTAAYSAATTTATNRDESQKGEERKKRKPPEQQHWKEKKKQKKQGQQTQYWRERSWEDVLKELQRREELERQYQQRHSDARLEKRIQGTIWRAMKICRALDERAGCPPTFVNGLWAPLYEQEVWRENHKGSLPEGWEWRWDPTTEIPTRIYRYVPTGEESLQHPKPEVERLLEKARNALAANKFRFHTEPRLFLGEIIDYLHEDHDYKDMDDDMVELEEEEQAKLAAMAGDDNDNNSNQKEYDY